MLLAFAPAAAWAWGPAGHALVARAALAASDGLPAWFRDQSDALASLANAPDRWRDVDRDVPALAARRPEHYFDLDDWGDDRLPADRWAYVREARRRRREPAAVGFLPYALQEGYGELLSAFRDARAGRAGAREAAIAAAGLLAHFAGDAAVPLHATRHHHGWIGPNPRGFTTSRGVHEWFETEMVARVDGSRVRATRDASRPFDDLPRAVVAVVADSLAQVPRLYEVEQRAARGDDAEARALVEARLIVGATFLARLWQSAWVGSG